MAVFLNFTFPSSGEETAESTHSATYSAEKRQVPQLQLQTRNTSREGDCSVGHRRRQTARTRYTPPASPTRHRASTMGAQHLQGMHDSGTITPPRTPSISHSKSGSGSSDLLSSLSTLRRGDSVSSISRPRLSLDESPRPGSTELIIFPHHSTDYEIRTDEHGRLKKLGEGAWSDVYLATPCPPKPTEQSSPPTPYSPDMTPPLTPVKTVDSAISLNLLPASPTPTLYAVKKPAMTSAKKVLEAEAHILSYLSRFPHAVDHITPFYGLDPRTGSLVLQAMDDTLEGWIQHHLNPLPTSTRSTKLGSVFPSIAHSLLTSLQWLHAHGCTHADIKPANILVRTATRSNMPIPLFTDFSSATLALPHNDDADAATAAPPTQPLGAGTWDYLDPSLLTTSSSTTPTAMPSPSSDLWALAVTLLVLVLGASPYDAFKANRFQQREMVKAGVPLQCALYGDAGVRNAQVLKGLTEVLGWDVEAWFGKVLVKDVGRRVGVREWVGALEAVV